MTASVVLYLLTGALLFVSGLVALGSAGHLLRQVLALNVMGAGVFMVLLALAARSEPADPVPQAMVLTGIVVAVSATAFALALLRRVAAATGRASVDDEPGEHMR
ncbi:MAG: NADH-quinone oxidoreductase subunit K [Halothiobacillaceae bacterium]